MNGPLYLDASAVLRWLLEEDQDLGERILASSLRLACSLTFLQTARAVIRAKAAGRMSGQKQRAVTDALGLLERASQILAVGVEALHAARQTFPHEPVRALDAIHLAAALAWRQQVGPLAIASMDEVLRRNAATLGFALVPE